MPPSLPDLEQRRERIAQRIAELGDLRPGSITATSSSSSGTELRPKRGNPAGLRPSLVCPAIINPY